MPIKNQNHYSKSKKQSLQQLVFMENSFRRVYKHSSSLNRDDVICFEYCALAIISML